MIRRNKWFNPPDYASFLRDNTETQIRFQIGQTFSIQLLLELTWDYILYEMMVSSTNHYGTNGTSLERRHSLKCEKCLRKKSWASNKKSSYARPFVNLFVLSRNIQFMSKYWKGRGGLETVWLYQIHWMLRTDGRTDRPTDKAGSRGAFAPENETDFLSS